MSVDIISALTEREVNEDVLLKYLNSLDTALWNELVEERFLARLCGYPLCDRELTVDMRKEFRVQNGKVVHTPSELRKFCSRQCLHFSRIVRKQLKLTAHEKGIAKYNFPRFTGEIYSGKSPSGQRKMGMTKLWKRKLGLSTGTQDGDVFLVRRMHELNIYADFDYEDCDSDSRAIEEGNKQRDKAQNAQNSMQNEDYSEHGLHDSRIDDEYRSIPAFREVAVIGLNSNMDENFMTECCKKTVSLPHEVYIYRDPENDQKTIMGSKLTCFFDTFACKLSELYKDKTGKESEHLPKRYQHVCNSNSAQNIRISANNIRQKMVQENIARVDLLSCIMDKSVIQTLNFTDQTGEADADLILENASKELENELSDELGSSMPNTTELTESNLCSIKNTNDSSMFVGSSLLRTALVQKLQQQEIERKIPTVQLKPCDELCQEMELGRLNENRPTATAIITTDESFVQKRSDHSNKYGFCDTKIIAQWRKNLREWRKSVRRISRMPRIRKAITDKIQIDLLKSLESFWQQEGKSVRYKLEIQSKSVVGFSPAENTEHELNSININGKWREDAKQLSRITRISKSRQRKRFHSGEDLNEVEYIPEQKRRKLILITDQKGKKSANTFDQNAKDRPHSKTNMDFAPLSNPGLLQGHTDNAATADNDAALVSPIVRTPRLENVHQQNSEAIAMQLLRLELELDKQWKEMQTVKDKLRRMTMKYCRIQAVCEREKQILAQNLNDERKKLDEVYAASYRNRIKIEASKEQSMSCAKETRTLERAICRMKLENAENKAEWEEEKRILAINLDHERKKRRASDAANRILIARIKELEKLNNDTAPLEILCESQNLPAQNGLSTQVKKEASAVDDDEVQPIEKRPRLEDLDSSSDASNLNIIADDIEFVGCSEPEKVIEANFPVKDRKKRVREIDQLVKIQLAKIKDLFPRMRPGNIKLVKNFDQLKKNFNDCVENWTNFCLVVEEAEKIGLLVQILEYTSSFLAQINSNAPFSIVDKIHGISAKLFEHFKLDTNLTKGKLIGLFDSHNQTVKEELKDAFCNNSSLSELHMKCFERRKADSRIPQNYLLKNIGPLLNSTKK